MQLSNLSNQQQTAIHQLQELLDEELLTIEEMIDLHTETDLTYFVAMADAPNKRKTDQICYNNRHTTRILRVLKQIKELEVFSHLLKIA